MIYHHLGGKIHSQTGDLWHSFSHLTFSSHPKIGAEAAYPGSDLGAATPGGATVTSEAATAGEEKVPTVPTVPRRRGPVELSSSSWGYLKMDGMFYMENPQIWMMTGGTPMTLETSKWFFMVCHSFSSVLMVEIWVFLMPHMSSLFQEGIGIGQPKFGTNKNRSFLILNRI